MPELTVIHFGLLALMLVSGVVVGWMVRGDRCAKEKIAVNASWQDQIQSQQSEHGRLAEQNKSLMEQISQYQASQKDYSNRAKELSDSLKEAFSRRDELQRQLKDIRGNLEVAIAQRDRLRSNLQSNPAGQASALKEKDDKIFGLSRELTSWQSRVPPLVQRFQERDKQARELEAELESAQARLQALEDMVKSDQTRIEPLDADSLPDGGDASNEPNALTSAHDTSELQDQIVQENDDDLTNQDQIDESDDDDLVDQNPVDESGDDDLVDQNPVDESAEENLLDPDPVEDTAEDVVTLRDFDEAAKTEDDHVEVAEDEHFDAVFADDNNNEEHGEEAEEPAGALVGGNESDNLRMIKGIGPSIEKTLNDLGVYRFHQIAEMSEYEIDRVAQQLKGFRSRIYREDWIGQARDLQYQKNNDRR